MVSNVVNIYRDAKQYMFYTSKKHLTLQNGLFEKVAYKFDNDYILVQGTNAKKTKQIYSVCMCVCISVQTDRTDPWSPLSTLLQLYAKKCGSEERELCSYLEEKTERERKTGSISTKRQAN